MNKKITKTNTKEKRDDDNQTRLVLWFIVIIIVDAIAFLHEVTGPLGVFLYQLGNFLFGYLWFLPYVLTLVYLILKLKEKNIIARHGLFVFLLFTSVLLFIGIGAYAKITGVDFLEQLFTNIKNYVTGKENLANGFIGTLIYGVIYRFSSVVGVYIFAIVFVAAALMCFYPEMKNYIENGIEKKKIVTNKETKTKVEPVKEEKKHTTLFDFKFKEKEKVEFNETKKESKFDTTVEKIELEPIKTQSNAAVTAGISSTGSENYDATYENYNLPKLTYLDAPLVKNSSSNQKYAMDKWNQLKEMLSALDLPSTLTKVNIGPSVIQFELTPDKVFNISRYHNAKDNLKMSLAVKDIRIEAPIPGKNTIGIEIPSQEKTMVCLRELLNSVPEKYSHEALMMPLGKDLSGNNKYANIEKMPHLLIAGTTGSGKSVCINSIILTLLLRTRPDEVKLLLIDPKKVTFTDYETIPHLICPVIYDAKQASNALKSLTKIMEERYTLLQNAKVKDISSYNKLPENAHKKMYSIVCVVDELYDLMNTAKAEVEDSIARLASMARAAGIHLILSTQRPSADVITGIIKTNISERIALSVHSGLDSRIIIDQQGAEELLGNGDMLYKAADASSPVRIQGVYVSDAEIKNVVNYFIMSGYVAKYADIFVVGTEENGYETADTFELSDPLYPEVERYVRTQSTVSASYLQRRFGLGFQRAAKIIDMLEQNGVISGSKGSKPRDVLVYNQGEEDV